VVLRVTKVVLKLEMVEMAVQQQDRMVHAELEALVVLTELVQQEVPEELVLCQA
jgi:hypothetical protein